MKLLKCASVTTALAVLFAPSINAQTKLWGEEGSNWKSDSILPDFSFAGYQRGNRSLPAKEVDVSVIDFGAVGDGKTDCTEAFMRAIEESSGKTIGIPKGNYLISGRLDLFSPATVLLGDGTDETILSFTKGLQEIEPTTALTGGGLETNQWSWSGGIIRIGKSSSSGKSSHFSIKSTVERGKTIFEVDESSGLEVGDICLIRVIDPPANSLIDYLYRRRTGDISLIKDKKIPITQAVTIKAVSGSSITIAQPLRFELRPEWSPVIYKFVNDSQEIGIADLTIRFPKRPYRGHWMEDGMNGFEIRGVNNWARNIRIQNCDSGVFVTGAWNTVEGLTIESSRKAHSSGMTGHHGVSLQGMECLMSNFNIKTRFFHDVTVSSGSIGNVFSKGSAIDMSIDHHRSAPYENLFTEIDLGVGSRVWSSGGTKGKGLHTASGGTFWNLDSKERFDLPTEEFGPSGLVFVGLNTKSIRKSDLVEGWHYEKFRPGRLQPPNLYLAQLQRRRGASNREKKRETEFLNWTNTNGDIIKAEFIGLTLQAVKLRMKNGKEYDYPIEKLSPDSQALATRLGK